MKQIGMFDENAADTPLFSGACLRMEAAPFVPQPQSQQTKMFACPLCRDTGRIDGRPCWCDGVAATEPNKGAADVCDH